MALDAIPQALWFFLPAFVANPMAVVFGGGTPIDFGRTLRDGERLFGDGKTWRGLLGGTVSGALLGFLLSAPFNLAAPNSVWSLGSYGAAFAAAAVRAFGALLGLRAIILITPALHRAVNVIGFRIGQKRGPW